jgi:hypothetical protein
MSCRIASKRGCDNIAAPTCEVVINAEHFVTLRDQVIAQVRANKSSATGDEDAPPNESAGLRGWRGVGGCFVVHMGCISSVRETLE